MNHRLLAQYGLKWNPFSPELPTEVRIPRHPGHRSTLMADSIPR
jgi:hypothetical protein